MLVVTMTTTSLRGGAVRRGEEAELCFQGVEQSAQVGESVGGGASAALGRSCAAYLLSTSSSCTSSTGTGTDRKHKRRSQEEDSPPPFTIKRDGLDEVTF